MKKQKAAKVFMGSALILLLAGCGSAASKTTSTKKDSDTNGKTKITWMQVLHTATPPTDTVINKIEDYTNTDITYNWMPAASYEERITTSLASGELADIVTFAKMSNSTVRSTLKTGAFWDVEKYLKDYPNLSKISKDLINSARIDGKLYGIPGQKYLSRSSFAIRKDWLENLNLEVPKTMEDMYKVAKAFTEDDPDGNGKDDTIGIADRGFNDMNFTSFKQWVTYFGGPNVWSVNSKGKFTHQSETKAYKEAMDFQKKLYDKGYLNQDFAVMLKTDQNDQFSQGKFGIYPGAGGTGMDGFIENGKALNSKFDLVGVNKISNGEGGKYYTWAESNGWNGLYGFPKSIVKTEKRLKQILSFMDKLYDKKPYELMTYGIEGVHYQLNDKGQVDDQDFSKYQSDVEALAGSRPDVTNIDIPVANKYINEGQEITKENQKYAVLDASIGLESETYNQVGSEIDKIIQDATAQYIMGQIDEDGFDAAVQKWNDQGGKQIKKEYAASYKLNNK
jgi:putative aldouronate transport system substrate-binding protein